MENKFQRSKYSGEQIMQFAFNEESQSLNTTVNGEMSIELSHEDGDSVTSHCPTLELSGNQEKACNYIKNVVLYLVKGSAKVQVSPLEEGELFFDLSLDHMSPKSICAKRIRLVLLNEDSEAYLCGQG